MYVQRNIEARSRNHRCRGKAISITYSECVCVCVCVCSLSYPAYKANVPYYIVICDLSGSYHIFPTLSHKRRDLRKKVTEHKMCVLTFSTTFVSNISHSKKSSARYYQMYIGLHTKYPLFLSDFNET
jgi:cytochrome c oxidase assembly protein Cox11